MTEMPSNPMVSPPAPPQGDKPELSKKQITWSLISIAIMLGTWLSSGMTSGIQLPHPIDWILHLITYFALGYALHQATGRWWLAWILAAWFGAFDEIHQAYFPGRDPGFLDWFFDLIGSGLGAFFLIWQNTKLTQDQTQPSEQAAAPMPVTDFQFSDTPATPHPQQVADIAVPAETPHSQVPPAPRPQPTPQAQIPPPDIEFQPSNNAPVHETAEAVEINFGARAKNKNGDKQG